MSTLTTVAQWAPLFSAVCAAIAAVLAHRNCVRICRDLDRDLLAIEKKRQAALRALAAERCLRLRDRAGGAA